MHHPLSLEKECVKVTEQEKRAVEILRGYGDPACYEQMIQSIVRGKGELLVVEKDAVMLRTRCEGFYMLAGSEQGMERLCGLVPPEAEDVILHGAISEPKLNEISTKLGLAEISRLKLYAYYGDIPPEETELDIRELGEDALDFVYENYGHASRAYLADRIADGVMIGAYVDGELAAFIGEHAEGAMGLLHVMPAYRRHHLGYKLEAADIRRTMQRGDTPFCQVFLDNTASHHLQERLHMTRSKGEVYWLSRQED